MAYRPVFRITDDCPYYKSEIVGFTYYNGFAVSQKKRSIASLHQAFLSSNSTEKVLDISSSSEESLGVALSAFNLQITTLDGKSYSVESAFQGSKVFEHGGPYKDLLTKTSREAKKDPRLKDSGKLISFYFSKKEFPLTPKTFFYNWLYINALHMHPELTEQMMKYTAFTDISFNPQRSINCQACAAAVYVSLRKNDLLAKALETPERFLRVVYGEECDSEKRSHKQMSLWEDNK